MKTYLSHFSRCRPVGLAAAITALVCGPLAFAQSSGSSGASGSGASTTAGSTGATRGSSDTSTGMGTSSTSGSSTYQATSGTSSSTYGSSTAGTRLKHSDRRFVTKTLESNQKELAFAQLALQRASNQEVRNFAQNIISDHNGLSQELMQLAQQKNVALDDDMRWSNSSSVAGTGTSAAGTSSGTYASGTGSRSTGTAGTGTTGISGTSSGTYGSTATGSGSGVGTSSGTYGSTGSPGTGGTGSGSYGSSGSADRTNSGTQDSSSMGLGWSGDRQYRRLARETGADFDREFMDMMVDEHERDVKMFTKISQDGNDPEVKAFAARNLPKLQQHLETAESLAKKVGASS